MSGRGGVPVDGPGGDVWEDFLADATAIAEDYREGGWEVIECRPGDVTAIESTDHDRFGFSVLVPESEYEAVEDAFADCEFESVEVFSHAAGGIVFVLAVERDERREVAVTVPVFYRRPDARGIFEVAEQRGTLPVHVRSLSTDRWVTFSHDEPSLFAGERSEEEEP